MGIAPVEELWTPPPRSECSIEEFPVDLSANDQVIYRLHSFQGRLVDFAMMHQARAIFTDQWLDVARFDCCHSEAHLHIFRKSDQGELTRRPLRSIKSAHDVDDAYDQASDLMVDGYEEHRRRWTVGR